MTTTTASQRNALGLPPALRIAQPAMRSAEVQEMLRKLSARGLGICMPHMHDENTGELQPLPDQLMQVEAGLKVSFQATAEVTGQAGRFLPVAWVWRDGRPMPSSVCEMVQDGATPDHGAPSPNAIDGQRAVTPVPRRALGGRCDCRCKCSVWPGSAHWRWPTATAPMAM